jgi:hypothetical protein
MRTIIVSKRSYGYVIEIAGNGRAFTDVLGSQHPESAAEALLALWEHQRNYSDDITVELPPEVEAIVSARGTIPWTRLT